MNEEREVTPRRLVTVCIVLVLGILMVIGVLLSMSPARGAEYPERAVHVVVPYPPGGSVDIVARYITSKMTWPTVVENRPGAGGLIAARHVQDAKPDGYTVLMGNITPNGIDPAWFFTPPSDSNLRLEPVAIVGGHPQVLLTRDPAVDARGLIERFRRGEPYGSDGIGGPSHLVTYMLAPNGLHVPYKGGAPNVQAMATGEVVGGFTPGPVGLPWVKSGKLRALATTAAQRKPPYEDLPTLRELGYGADIFAWTGMFAPVGTPANVIAAWHAQIDAVVDRDREWFEANGFTVMRMSTEGFARYVEAEHDKWRAVTKGMMQ